MTPRYNDYSSYVRQRFGGRVSKLSIDAGFTCPNRDGSKGVSGCTYCNNRSFRPAYCAPAMSVSAQLIEGRQRLLKRGKSPVGFLAYFQSYSNTYGSVELLERLYSEALAVDGIIGLAISTRPDCISSEVLDLLGNIARTRYVALEFGVESCRDETLLAINRCHTFADAERGIRHSAGRNIDVGAHLILGLPGEDRADMLGHAAVLSALPLQKVKLHQLQIVRHTRMARDFRAHGEAFRLFGQDEYVELVADFLERLRPDLVVERLAGETARELLIAPRWTIRSAEVSVWVNRELQRRGTRQGSRCESALR